MCVKEKCTGERSKQATVRYEARRKISRTCRESFFCMLEEKRETLAQERRGGERREEERERQWSGKVHLSTCGEKKVKRGDARRVRETKI